MIKNIAPIINAIIPRAVTADEIEWVKIRTERQVTEKTKVPALKVAITKHVSIQRTDAGVRRNTCGGALVGAPRALPAPHAGRAAARAVVQRGAHQAQGVSAPRGAIEPRRCGARRAYAGAQRCKGALGTECGDVAAVTGVARGAKKRGGRGGEGRIG